MDRTTEKMKTVTFGEGKTYTLDRFGYLDPPQQWDEDFAEGMARLQGIYKGLTEEHWDFINYIRGKAQSENQLPLLVTACVENNLRLGKLKSLFPSGYFRGACRIAGLSYKFLSDSSLLHMTESAPRLRYEYSVDSRGFLEDFDQWDEHFANLIGSEWRLPSGLTPKHWEIIHYLRNFYLASHNIPTAYEVCKAHDIELDGLNELFPEGYRRGACRIAGLPFFA